MNHDDQTITLLVEDGIHSLYEIKNRCGSKIITAMPVSHIRNTTSSDPRSNSNVNLKSLDAFLFSAQIGSAGHLLKNCMNLIDEPGTMAVER